MTEGEVTTGSSLSFIKKHHFKDTLALLILFLSFNHFASLLLLVSFSIVTRSRNFLADCFTKLFLPQNKLRNTINDEDYEIKPVQSSAFGYTKNKKKHTTNTKQVSTSEPGDMIKQSPWDVNKKTAIFFILEAFFASMVQYYGDKYFSEPVENLAMSIIASSLVNDPKDALSIATTSSIIYALSTQWIQKVLSLLEIDDHLFTFPSKQSKSRWSILMHKYPNFTERIPFLLEILEHMNKYVRFATFLASFHVVVSQIEINMIIQSYEREASEQAPISDKSASIPTVPTQSSSVSSNTNKDMPSTSLHVSTSSTNVSSTAPNPVSLKGSASSPRYTSFVQDFSVNEMSIESPSDSDSKTWVPNITTAFSTEEDMEDKNDFSNQVYELTLNIDAAKSCPDLTTISMVNLKIFVRQLFRWKNHHLISPIWSIFTATQTLISERKNLTVSNDNVTPLTTTVPITDHKIDFSDGDSSNLKNDLSPMNSNGHKSVFTSKAIADSMTLIAPTMDDYHKLNLVSTELNNNYKVCITFIGPNSITFRIDNLFEGELIVLVNGVIWSQIGSAIIQNVPGQEYTVVSGLVPQCSYDIQFVNRLNKLEDYLIADLMVRTIGKNGTQEPLDCSFPSYYHRKFLSPILTLKHSVLTTNANLVEERMRSKKTRKEVTKKLNIMKQDIESLKTKIEANTSQDEKSASKVENLKMALKQGEKQVKKLEEILKHHTAEESTIEEKYLAEKDRHLQRSLEVSKAEDFWKFKLVSSENSLRKLKQDLQQLQAKKEKAITKYTKLQKEVEQINNHFEKFKDPFLEKRNKDRIDRNQARALEANDFELRIKGLEQDISRLEGEANNLQAILMHQGTAYN